MNDQNDPKLMPDFLEAIKKTKEEFENHFSASLKR